MRLKKVWCNKGDKIRTGIDRDSCELMLKIIESVIEKNQIFLIVAEKSKRTPSTKARPARPMGEPEVFLSSINSKVRAISGGPPRGYYPPHGNAPGLGDAPKGEWVTDTLANEAIKFIKGLNAENIYDY